ncbi:hypothetical protein L9F63_025009 [Diploptera punctata]|uniref:Uncharacterized protein n=1 Tax=Diploptera punctata TaxID=6984 RepID=A0AAD7ZD45_DIPPU|nr:hypothetical protein L9F63_025009 [Diploptera punctata]
MQSLLYMQNQMTAGMKQTLHQKSMSFLHSDREIKKVGVYVVVYEGKHYPGMITKCYKEGTLVNVMELSGKHWKWPEQKDEILYQGKEIMCKINAPKKKGKRDIYDVPEMNRLPA